MFAWIRVLVSRTRTWFLSRQVDEDFEHEMESHLDMLTHENVRRGMAPEEAKRAARMRLGGVTQLKETNRELRGLPMIETLLQDTRFAFRMLRKNPGFTAVAVLTLALGIGANTAIFSVVYAVLLKPLPYANPDQLFTAFQANKQQGITETGCSYPNFEEWRAQNHVFSELGGILAHQLTLTGRGEPSFVNMVVKSTLSTASVAGAIRQEVQKIDKDLPVTDVAKMPDLIDASVAQPRFRTFLLGFFAAMALVLAATGIFGVIAYSVSCRTREIGVRMALGASRSAIMRMVLRETLVLTLTGLALGIPCALAASHLLGHMLFDVSANDPATLVAVAFVLVAVAALAGYVPVRRAMGVDPMVALRYE